MKIFSLEYFDKHCIFNILGLKIKLRLKILQDIYKKTNSYKNYFKVLKKPVEQKRFLKEHLNFINIETFSKCNRQCWFCTNSIIDRHSFNHRMDENLYKKIIDDLASVNYKGAITYSYYNEPLLDEIIVERIKYARKMLPEAFLFTHTNGDYLTEEYLDKLADAGLNKLKIQCYLNKNEEFNSNYILENKINNMAKRINKTFDVIQADENFVEVVYNYDKMAVQQNAFNFEKVGTNRGSSIEGIEYQERLEPCFSPFYRMYVTYEGIVLPCCNVRQELNPSFVMGDLTKNSIFEVFSNENFVKLRKLLEKTGEKIKPCNKCTGVAANICEDIAELHFKKQVF